MTTVHSLLLSNLASFQQTTPQGQAVGVPGATAAPTSASPAATTTTGAGGQPLPAQPATSAGSPFSMMIPMMVVMVVLIGFTWWNGRKQGKKREELLKSAKKGDRVATSGGVIGMIVELTDDEMVLQVEQGKIRFSRSALAGVLKSGRELADAKVEIKQATVSV